MKQTRAQSIGETVVSTAIGFALNLAAQRLVFPLFGFTPPIAANFAISAIFTVISLGRQYATRRAFNWWHHRSL